MAPLLMRLHTQRYPIVTLCCLISCALQLSAEDWPQYRGPNHNGVSTDRIRTDWTGAATNPVWRITLTNSVSSLSVVNGRVFTQTRRSIGGTSMEVCVALNADTGAELWARPVDIADYPQGGIGFDDGPRSTPVVNGDNVYVLTSYMKLYRLNAADGEIVWVKDLRMIYGSLIIRYQNAASPVVENDLIYLNANCRTETLMALRTSDGSLAWRANNEAATHATPVLATIQGVRQLIFATQSGLVSLNPATGSFLWKHLYPFNFFEALGCSPVVHSNMIFVSGAHAYSMGSVTIEANFSNGSWTTTRLWSTNNPATHWMTPNAHDGFLYGLFGIQQFDSVNGQLKCIDMRTGMVRWSTNGFGRGATVVVGNHLVVLTEKCHLALVELSPSGYSELGRFVALPNWHTSTNKSWNSPAVCDGRIYVRSTSFVACFDLSMDELKLGTPQFTDPEHLTLSARSTTGAPIDSSRVNGLQLRMTEAPDQPLDQWSLITNAPVLSEGQLFFHEVETTPAPRRFFILLEDP